MSTLKADTIQNTSGGAVTLTKQDAAKCWTSDETLASDTAGVWTGDTFNVASITDETTGQCLVNFTNGFGNTGFSSTGSQSGFSVNDILSTKEDNTTSARDNVYIYDGSYRDAPFCYVVFGDLA